MAMIRTLRSFSTWQRKRFVTNLCTYSIFHLASYLQGLLFEGAMSFLIKFSPPGNPSPETGISVNKHPAPLTEALLIHQCKAGSEQARRQLYEQYAPRLYRLCFRYVRQPMDAEEILINGFLKVFGHIGKFEATDSGSLERWMKKIMVNESLMFLRKQVNFNLVADTYARSVEAGSSPETELSAEEIYALILALPVGYRTVFNLYAIEGYSHKEIASQLGISEGTSKSQLSKARAMLQQLLKKNGITYEAGRTGKTVSG